MFAYMLSKYNPVVDKDNGLELIKHGNKRHHLTTTCFQGVHSLINDTTLTSNWGPLIFQTMPSCISRHFPHYGADPL